MNNDLYLYYTTNQSPNWRDAQETPKFFSKYLGVSLQN